MSPISPYVEGSAVGLAAPTASNNGWCAGRKILCRSSLVMVSDLIKHRVGVLILSPLTGGLGPQYTWYEPFLGARHVFTRGIGDHALKLNLQTLGKRMVAGRGIPTPNR